MSKWTQRWARAGQSPRLFSLLVMPFDVLSAILTGVCHHLPEAQSYDHDGDNPERVKGETDKANNGAL